MVVRRSALEDVAGLSIAFRVMRGTPCGLAMLLLRMTRPTRLLFGLLASMALPCVAGAQNPQPAPPQEAHPPVAPPNASQPPPEQIARRRGTRATT